MVASPLASRSASMKCFKLLSWRNKILLTLHLSYDKTFVFLLKIKYDLFIFQYLYSLKLCNLDYSEKKTFRRRRPCDFRATMESKSIHPLTQGRVLWFMMSTVTGGKQNNNTLPVLQHWHQYMDSCCWICWAGFGSQVSRPPCCDWESEGALAHNHFRESR